ncbi:hypothetical protein C8R44DRAFT_223319 [Mycena epipterygia]|nr:hypothetical protein C8R44DRAFT_223319 [Mycena epipterygia]
MPLPSLRNLLSFRPRPADTGCVSSLPRLPPELWELVLQELDDDNLLIAARVCSAFNDRCVAIHLGRNDITPISLATGTLSIHSHLISVLQLARQAPQVHTLECRFWAFHILRDMKLLREFLVRSQELKDLHLVFHGNMIDAHSNDAIFPYSQDALLTQFRDILRAMATKSTGPVVVIASPTIHMIHARDLAEWGLRYFLHVNESIAPVAWIDKAWSTLKPEKSDPHLSILVCRRGLKRKFICTESVYSVRVVAITAAPDPFTLICFNPDTQPLLELGPSWLHTDSVAAARLTAILPSITLPSLGTLQINAEVDPAVLRGFLLRHPSIHSINDYRVELSPSPSLLSSPLSHPIVTRLSCKRTAHLPALLASLSASPNLGTIALDIKRHSPADVAQLTRALRCLSLRTGSPIRLEAHAMLFVGWKPWLPIEAEERSVLGCLWCVECVDLRATTVSPQCLFRLLLSARAAFLTLIFLFFFQVSDARRLIPWLAMLPALRRVEVSISRVGGYRPEMGALVEEVWGAMPWVSLVEVREEES